MLTRPLIISPLAGAAALAAVLCALPAAAEDAQVYTVSAYPVEATAGNAVAAKEQAMAEGREGAFRYLLKRIVDVGAYRRLPHVQPAEIEDMLDGLQVDRETNSRTDYIATLTYKFKADAIRDLLRNYKLPFFDRQADAISVITAFVSRDGGSKEGARAWSEAWASLDLVHALTPVQLIAAGPSATPEVFQRLADGDPQAFGIVESEANAQKLVVALAELVGGGKKLRVKLVGADQAGPIDLASSYTLYYDDIGYTSEHAALIALGILEGRWKSVNVGFRTSGPDDGGITPWSSDTGNPGADGPRLRVVAEFSGASQWRDLRTRFLETPGVEDVEIASISAQYAEITFAYGSGIGELRNVLARAGIALGDVGGTLVMRIE